MKTALLRRIALCLTAVPLLLAACSTEPPENKDNLCSIFQEKDSWYVAAYAVHDRYGVPIDVAMAILAQESGYSDGRQPMRWILFIPYGRGAEAPGYARSGDDEIWKQYVAEVGTFFSTPSRDDFEDSLDFMGWYMTRTKAINGIPFMDAYNQYLNYREGWEAYTQGSYKSKDWLIQAAEDVKKRAAGYRSQLKHCVLY